MIYMVVSRFFATRFFPQVARFWWRFAT